MRHSLINALIEFSCTTSLIILKIQENTLILSIHLLGNFKENRMVFFSNRLLEDEENLISIRLNSNFADSTKAVSKLCNVIVL